MRLQCSAPRLCQVRKEKKRYENKCIQATCSLEGLEDKIWRDIEISGNYLLNRLGYCVLVTFDTMAYHLFEFNIKNEKYVIPNRDFPDKRRLDMAYFKFHQLELNVGDSFTMDYDFGTTQTFNFKVKEIRPLERGHGRAYPRIVAGEGICRLTSFPN